MPVVGVLAPLLGEVRAGPLGAEDGRLLPDVVAALGDPLGADVPVVGPDEERVAVAAAVVARRAGALPPPPRSAGARSRTASSFMVSDGSPTMMKAEAQKTSSAPMMSRAGVIFMPLPPPVAVLHGQALAPGGASCTRLYKPTRAAVRMKMPRAAREIM